MKHKSRKNKGKATVLRLKFFMYAVLVLVLFPAIPVKAGHDNEKIPHHLQQRYDRRLEEMKVLDINGDGVLQAEELKKKSRMSFGAADTDKDGILSRKEIEAAQKNAKEKSKNKYDSSKSTANRHAMRVKSQLKNADRNDDRKVSQEEYEAYYGGRHKTYDRNGDGIITEKEYRSDFEKLPSRYRRAQR